MRLCLQPAPPRLEELARPLTSITLLSCCALPSSSCSVPTSICRFWASAAMPCSFCSLAASWCRNHSSCSFAWVTHGPQSLRSFKRDLQRHVPSGIVQTSVTSDKRTKATVSPGSFGVTSNGGLLRADMSRRGKHLLKLLKPTVRRLHIRIQSLGHLPLKPLDLFFAFLEPGAGILQLGIRVIQLLFDFGKNPVPLHQQRVEPRQLGVCLPKDGVILRGCGPLRTRVQAVSGPTANKARPPRFRENVRMRFWCRAWGCEQVARTA